MDKSKLKTIITTVILTFVVSFLAFFLLFNRDTRVINQTLKDGYYVAKSDYGEMSLDVEGKKVLVDVNGLSDIGTINNSKKTITFKGQDGEFKFELISNKVVLNYEGTKITFKKSSKENSDTDSSKKETSKTSSSKKETSNSNSLTLEKLKEETESVVGLKTALAYEKIRSIESANDDVTIYVDFLNEDGKTILSSSEEGKNGKVIKVLSVEKYSDDDNSFNVKFVIGE